MKWRARKERNKTEETADISDIHSGFGLHVHFFSLSPQDGRRGGGGGAYQNESLQQFPTTSIVITSIPLPTVFLDVLTWRNTAMHQTV